MKDRNFSAMLRRAKARERFWVESAILDVTEEILARMEKLGVSRSELARRLGKKPPFITKLLRGGNNFTLETLVRVAHALDARVRMDIQPKHDMAESRLKISARSAIRVPAHHAGCVITP